jgi:hypothetical protein
MRMRAHASGRDMRARKGFGEKGASTSPTTKKPYTSNTARAPTQSLDTDMLARVDGWSCSGRRGLGIGGGEVVMGRAIMAGGVDI